MNEPLDQLEPIARPLKAKMPLAKVVLINLGVMLVYMMFFRWGGDESVRYPMPITGMLILLSLATQLSLNLLAGLILVFIPTQKHLGRALLLGGVITAVIGLIIGIATDTENWF